MSQSFKDRLVYQKAFKLAMEIYHVSKGFPPLPLLTAYCLLFYC